MEEKEEKTPLEGFNRWPILGLLALLFVVSMWPSKGPRPQAEKTYPTNYDVQAKDMQIHGLRPGSTRAEVEHRFAAYKGQFREPGPTGWVRYGVDPGGLGFHDATEVLYGEDGKVKAVAAPSLGAGGYNFSERYNADLEVDPRREKFRKTLGEPEAIEKRGEAEIWSYPRLNLTVVVFQRDPWYFILGPADPPPYMFGPPAKKG